jgi:hypothetical protein
MNEIFDGPSLALSPPCCVAHRSRSFGYALIQVWGPFPRLEWRLAWRQNGGGLTANNLIHGALGRQLAAADFAGQAGLQQFELRSAHWPPGTYWVSVIVDGHREVRLVKKF